MNDPSSQQGPPQTVNEGIRRLARATGEGIRLQQLKCEDRVREYPGCALLAALAAGYLLYRLPVRAMVLTQVRVFSALASSLLVCRGAAALHDILWRRKPERQDYVIAGKEYDCR